MKEIPKVVWCEFATSSNKMINVHEFNPLDKAHPHHKYIAEWVEAGQTVIYEYRIRRKGGLG